MLQKITQEYNEKVDAWQKTDLSVKFQFFKRKVYTLIPPQDQKADNKTHFISLLPSAAVGFFWRFNATDSNIDLVNDKA